MKSVNLNKLRYDGVEAAKRGDIQIATDCFEKILNLNQTPSSSDYTNAGMAQRINGDFHRAKKYFESALKLNSSNRNAVKNLVLCLLDLDRPSEAIDLLGKILAKTDDSELRQLQFKSAFRYLSPMKAVKMLDSHLRNQTLNTPETELLLQGLRSIRCRVKDASTEICKAHNYLVDNIPEQLDDLSSLEAAVNRTSGLQTIQTQIFFGADVDLGCKKHFSVFSATRTIPQFCFGCIKVQANFLSLEDLFAGTAVLRKQKDLSGYIQKSMIELRNSSGYRYKIFAYTRHEQEARAISEKYTNLLSRRIASVDIKRGCSEFSELYPTYSLLPSDPNSMEFPTSWEESQRQHYPSPVELPNIVKQCENRLSLADLLIYKNWIAFRDLNETSKEPILSLSEINNLSVFNKFNELKRKH